MKFNWGEVGESGKLFGEGKTAEVNTNTFSAFKNKFTIGSIALVLVGLVGVVASSHYSGSKNYAEAEFKALYDVGCVSSPETIDGNPKLKLNFKS